MTYFDSDVGLDKETITEDDGNSTRSFLLIPPSLDCGLYYMEVDKEEARFMYWEHDSAWTNKGKLLLSVDFHNHELHRGPDFVDKPIDIFSMSVFCEALAKADPTLVDPHKLVELKEVQKNEPR